MLKHNKIFICFVQVKFYSNSLTSESVNIAKIISHGIVTGCINAGLFEFSVIRMCYAIRFFTQCINYTLVPSTVKQSSSVSN